MTPKTRKLMEAVADIAFVAGGYRHYSGDSRKDISDYIQWAIEFESLAKEEPDGSVTYNGKEYMEAVEWFALDKVNIPVRPEDPGWVIPPDAENMNQLRASWAAQSLTRFREVTGTDAEDAVADLIANLMHYCDYNRIRFSYELNRARGMYHDETRELPETGTATPITDPPTRPENDVPF